MASSVSVSFRIAEEKAQAIDRLSKAVDRPRSWLLEQALDAYLDAHEWQVGHIERGLQEARSGAGTAHEDVAAWLESWGADVERPAPA